MIREIIEGKRVEESLIRILSEIHVSGPVNPADFEKLAFIKELQKEIFKKYEKKLIYLLGLFYKTSKPQSILEEVYSVYASAIKKETGANFTPMQAHAYKNIHNKKYFSFSAPTSTGKSYLFRELIQREQGDLVIVVPSRALIAEYIYAILELVDNSVLVLPFIENINIRRTKRRIFVITPERGTELFKFEKEFKIDLFLLDEAQISEEEIRGMKFDSFVRRIDRVFPNARKVFAQPFVDNPGAQLEKHNFNPDSAAYMKYNQNTVGKICFSLSDGGFSYFSPFSQDAKREFSSIEFDMVERVIKKRGTILVYISKKKIYSGQYRIDFDKYIKFMTKLSDGKAMSCIEKLRDFIGATDEEGKEKYSVMIKMMERGVVIHHGSMPLTARFIIEDFVRKNYARMCFATSTLNQGINMPFDVVWIDNFNRMEVLTLRNLIGRAGRTTRQKNVFEYGYVIIRRNNVKTFSGRLNDTYKLNPTSLLDEKISNISEDLKDVAEAIRNDTFNDELHLTETQVERLKCDECFVNIKYILDNLLKGSVPIQGKEYCELPNKKKIKEAFKAVFTQHLRRKELTSAEMGVLSAAIPIMLWRIQGKSFKEIVSLRYSFLSRRDERREIHLQVKRNEITQTQELRALKEMKIRYTPPASILPNTKLRQFPLFSTQASVLDLDYDTLVYDTYDYLDKVISLSLTDSLTAAFQIYYEATLDGRALVMKNYVRYGTNDDIEIWLARYGFGFEDIEWIKAHVESVDEKGIVFKPSINSLEEEKKSIIKRYI